jgi:hypothetical protein
MLHTSCFKNTAALLVAMLVLLARPGGAQLVMCDPRGPDHLDACPGGLACPDCKQAFCPCPCPMKFLSQRMEDVTEVTPMRLLDESFDIQRGTRSFSSPHAKRAPAVLQYCPRS